jgi:hypothetical protein
MQSIRQAIRKEKIPEWKSNRSCEVFLSARPRQQMPKRWAGQRGTRMRKREEGLDVWKNQARHQIHAERRAFYTLNSRMATASSRQWKPLLTPRVATCKISGAISANIWRALILHVKAKGGLKPWLLRGSKKWPRDGAATRLLTFSFYREDNS